MDLILLRHGISAERDMWTGSDAERPLTADGVAGSRALCRALRHAVAPSQILTSPLRRACETAHIAAESWALEPIIAPWLATYHFDLWCTELATAGPCPLLVGHQPSLGVFAGALTGGAPLALKKAGVALLRGTPSNTGMQLRALLSPGLLAAVINGGDR
ncbi:MAG: SixA phosphatase family protein [Planctomycetota bacterium]|jgi:phosphohistidine phosphatase